MKTELRSSMLLLVGLGLVTAPLFTGCDGGESTNTGGNGGTTATTTAQGGGGTAGGTTTASQGGGGAGGATGGSGGTGGTGGAGGGTGGTGAVPTGDYDCAPAEGAVPPLKLTEVASGFNSPVFVRAAPGDNDRLYVVEKTGRIQILKNGVENPEPFLDISDRVQNNGEQGLLGLAFHPDYQNNGRFFVFYTNKGSQDQNIAEYARDPANPELATAAGDGFGTEVQLLLKVDDPESNHNGGMIDFSPVDGFLYIGLGDGGGANDNHGQFGNGLNLGTLWGKIARIDVSTTPYSIPAGNMTAIPAGNPSTGAVLPEIWSYGLRNPWRFAFDPCNGDMYIGDVGQGQWEEVDVEPAGLGGRNYGWKAFEGNHVFNNNLAGMILDHTPPVAEYAHDVPNSGNDHCSITGGFLHRSKAIPGIRGRYFYGDYCTGVIWSFAWDGSGSMQTVTQHNDLSGAGNITSFGSDNQGNVYVVANASVFRIDAE